MGPELALILIMNQNQAKPIQYPPAVRQEVVDVYHGVEVRDPYRWLENPDAPETRKWIAAQNKLTRAHLDIPERARIRKRYEQLFNFRKYGVPQKEGGRYFWTENSGLQNQSVLYWAPSLTAKPRVLLDPNLLSKDGTVALAGTAISDDGKHLAYALQKAGSDWMEWKVRDVATSKDLKDHIQWSKFSGASWTADGKGFFYSRYDAPKPGQKLQEQNYFQKLYYHRLGTPQSQDVLIYERKDQKEWGFDGTVSEDGRYLVISVWHGTEPKNRVFVMDLKKPGAFPVRYSSKAEAHVQKLIPEPDASYGFLGNKGTVFYFQTDLDAPLGRIIAIDIARPDRKSWRTVVPESKNNLEGSSIVGGRIFANYLKNASTQIRLHELDGKFLKEIKLPGIGSAGGFGGRMEQKETFYTYTSFTYPPTIFRYNVADGTSSVFRQPKVDVDPNKYETRQVFFMSKDGTRVPMFVTYRKGLELNGQNPTLLYGYGGFRSSETPYFSASRLMWMEMGGVYALVNLRGGGEYGKDWHDAGRLKNKQNVFADFIAAAEHLVELKYTRPDKLAIQGGSNGGLLVGAVLNQRPELFGAAVPEVGVMDMLRFHKWTIGWAWVSDYGSPDDPEMFPVLRAYSPYHNIREGAEYPPTLILTADHDDRVVPAHSFKYAAALQHGQGGEAPVLIRIETDAGHGGGKPTAKIIDEVADVYTFLVRSLRMTLPAGFGK
ncbi:MAG TPA: prolyl oligopeptidase family serine peptidase [Fimbriimonadaceae bacterium]|nr:prolyl oligopeptidase family serine peptidase [Fimbriimonadaceae bacterium]